MKERNENGKGRNGRRPTCTLERRDVFAALFRVDRALREARLNRQADEFLERVTEFALYDDVVRLARDYVEVEEKQRQSKLVA